MLNPHHVEALAYERQRELLETAAQVRRRRRHGAGAGAARATRPASLFTRATAWFSRTFRPAPAQSDHPRRVVIDSAPGGTATAAVVTDEEAVKAAA